MQVDYSVYKKTISELKAEDELLKYRLRLLELRYNPNHDPKNGQFCSGNGLTGGGRSGIIKTNRKVYSFEEYTEKPILLGETTAEEKHDYYKLNSYDISPLSNGNFKGMDFKKGGGFIVRFNDKQSTLMYHPPGRTHHGKDAYYKLSSGKIGKRRYNMDGTPRKE